MLILFPLFSFGQENNLPLREVYVVDSIPIIEEPEEGFNTLSESLIHEIIVVNDKEELKKLGFGQMDRAIYIFTKAYANRPEEIKAIPTTMKMDRKNGAWYLKGADSPYSGKFIDYYITGNKEGEGTFKNGLVEGLRTKYYPNGNVSLERNYKAGFEHGREKEYYEDGTLKQTGVFENFKETGRWESYFSNGQLKQTINFENGVMVGEAVVYYSTGQIKTKQVFKMGKPELNKNRKKLIKQYNQGLEYDRTGNFKGSIKSYSKCIVQDTTFVEAYFARGTAKLNNLQFDEALKDFTKAVKIEPLFKEAYSNRAFSIIRKYQIGNGRVLKKNSNVTVLASESTFDIPENELKLICNDLNLAVSLGDKSRTVLLAVDEYCKK